MFWTYIIQNPAGQFYVGHTDNLSARVKNHNRTDEIARKFTRKDGPWTLVWSEEHPNRSSAMRREREIKKWKSAHLIRTRLLRIQA
jgi:predicted GIY-YIG superfamily endonuclease